MLAASILVISLSLLMFVKPHQVRIIEQQKRQRKKARANADIERGRSRVSKDLSSPAPSNNWPSMPSGSGSSTYSGRYSAAVVESQPIRSKHGSGSD